MVTHHKEVYYRLGVWHLDLNYKTKTRDSHLQYLGWLPTNPRMVTHQKEVYYNLGIWHLDLTYNCQEWSPTIPTMVTHQKDVYYRHGI